MAISEQEQRRADEREALFRLIDGYEPTDTSGAESFSARDSYGLVDQIIEAGFHLGGGLGWEYGVASYGDTTDIILEPGVPRSSLGWALGALQQSYGDTIVRRGFAGQWLPFDSK